MLEGLRSNRWLRSTFERHPRLQPLAREAYALVTRRPPVHFFGWEMTTDHEHPWVDEHHWAEFRQALEDVHGFEHSTQKLADVVDTLQWRHWIVAYAMTHALASSGERPHVSAVECGSWDGLSAYFALVELEAARAKGRPDAYEFHLYDAWAGMRAEDLTASEADHTGRYDDTEVGRCQRNLARFADHLEFHVGYVPETLDGPPPDDLVFVHIDLNASAPTVAALEHFWPALVPGGVVLFDDYGWRAYADTKRVVDDFFADRPGSLMKLPTGQAIYFR